MAHLLSYRPSSKSLLPFIITCLLCSSLFSMPSHAQTRYVKDSLFVPLRSGESPRHRIVHKGLKSGTAVTLIESNSESKYSKVRTKGGTVGWIPSHYLLKQPTAAIRLEAAEATIAKLKETASPMAAQVRQLEEVNTKLENQLRATLKDNDRLNNELAEIKKTSANAISLDRNNKKLMKDSEMLKNELDIANANVKRLTDNVEKDFFIFGALAVCLGVFIALIVPLLRPRKRNSEWG